MSTQTQPTPTLITISATELEVLLRRIVREEISRVLRPVLNPVDDWSHEGPDDPEGDAILLADALEQIEYLKTHPEDLMSLEDFEAELKQAEAAGELPG
jgi:hypothetical protein